MKLNKIPATVVTGFLGSGKTTLLSNLLKQANGKRIAVIVNEFGELDIDAELLRNCPLECEEPADESNEGIYELANGCICCTVEEEFLPVMRKLIERRDQIDHILIETSGLALPKPLVQAFNWPDIKQACTVDAVITVVDGPAVAAGSFANDPERVEQQRRADENLDHDPSLQELLDDQLSAADLVVISKGDCMDEDARQKATEVVRSRLPKAVKTLFVENGEVDIQLLFGLGAASEDGIEAVATHHDHHHAHDNEHHHAHDNFDSCVVALGAVDSDKLLQVIQELIAEHSIYRVKGFVANGNKPMRQVVQAVGERIAHYFDRLWAPEEARHTRLVFIGKELDADRLRSALSTAVL